MNKKSENFLDNKVNQKTLTNALGNLKTLKNTK